MSDIIAERRFELKAEDGTVSDLFVKIVKPYVDPTRDDIWYSQITIEGLEGEYIRSVPGSDSYGALRSAIRLAQVHIRLLSVKHKGRLTWLDTDDILIEEVYTEGDPIDF